MEAVRVKVKEEGMIVIDDFDGIGGGMIFVEKFDEIDGRSGGGSGGEVTFKDEVVKKEEKLDDIDSGGSDGEVRFEDGVEKKRNLMKLTVSERKNSLSVKTASSYLRVNGSLVDVSNDGSTDGHFCLLHPKSSIDQVLSRLNEIRCRRSPLRI